MHEIVVQYVYSDWILDVLPVPKLKFSASCKHCFICRKIKRSVLMMDETSKFPDKSSAVLQYILSSGSLTEPE